MNLFHHDTTGTQTDSAKPLSRKKLRSLMSQNRAGLTGGQLAFKSKGARPSMQMRIARKVAEREERLKAIYVETPQAEGGHDDRVLAAAMAEIVKPAEAKPTISDRISDMLGLSKFQRRKAMGTSRKNLSK